MYGLRAIVNRCGVISGPWQMGKVDQGFVVLWAARHVYGGALTYTGFGGAGLQVRDVLHVDDLYDLLRRQIDDMPRLSGGIFNVGGGYGNSVSLAELTLLCRTRAGRAIPIDSQPKTSDADVPYYISDNTAVTAATGWVPQRGLDRILDDIVGWLRDHGALLEPLLGAAGPATTTTVALPSLS
jgi:CDP-paratose 2-epimerase